MKPLSPLATLSRYVSRNHEEQEIRKAMKLYRKHQRMCRSVATDKKHWQHQGQDALRNLDVLHLQQCTNHLKRVQEREHLLHQLSAQAKRTYVFSSDMLRKSFEICTALPAEGLHFITGIEVDGVLVGTKIVQFPYAHRSITGAKGDHLATHRICIDLHENGHRLISMIHSHPGKGIDANHPSNTDIRTQKNWELTTSVIGGIWSRCGHLRWYSVKLPFHVQISGTHGHNLQPKLWKLNDEHI